MAILDDRLEPQKPRNQKKNANIQQHLQLYQNSSIECSPASSWQALQYIHMNTDIWTTHHQGPFYVLDIYKGGSEEYNQF